MLYATIDKQRWDSLPAEWNEVQDMFKYLNRMTYGYQLTMERKMFATQFGYEFRCCLIRWGDATFESGRKRDVLLETDDPKQMESALFMLINEAETQAKAHIKMNVSMVP